MALATQCPHCGTTFRVAHDQLKLRAGMVRCGTCQHIFNGIEQLVVAGSATPPPTKPVQTQKPPAAEIPPAPSMTTAPVDIPIASIEAPPTSPAISDAVITALAPEEDDGLDFALEPFGLGPTTIVAKPVDSLVDSGLSESAKVESSKPQSQVELPDDDVDFSMPENPVQDAVQPDVMEEDSQPVAIDSTPEDLAEIADDVAYDNSDEIVTEPLENRHVHDEALSQADLPAAALEDDEELDEDTYDQRYPQAFEVEGEPEFVKRGRRKQKRRRTVRIAISIAIFFLLIGLTLQSAYTFRSLIAASYPPAKPALAQMCKIIGCQIGLPAQIDNLTIEPNDRALLSLDKNKTVFEFNVLLRNHSNLPQTWPYIELTLNDTAGKAVVRRIFKSSEFPLPAADLLKGIAPNSEQNIKLFFKLSQVKASGYTVQVFYP